MANQTLDYHAMYMVAGDIVGSISRYNNQLKSVNSQVNKAISSCDKADKYNGKWVYCGEITRGKVIYRKYQRVVIDSAGARSSLKKLQSDVEQCSTDLKSLRKEANDSEAVAAGIKAHVKKMQATLSPDTIAKVWKTLGLSIDMYAAKKGNKVSISGNGADWDGTITFKRMPNGTYMVLKGNTPMGFCTPEQKKEYYKALYKANKDIKNKVDGDQSTREKREKDYENLNSGDFDTQRHNKDSGTSKALKVSGSDDLPNDLKNLINSDFKGKSGLTVKVTNGNDVYIKQLKYATVYDSNGNIVGRYDFGGPNGPRRTSYDWKSAGKVVAANAAGLGAGFVEGVPKFFEGTIDLGARGVGLAAKVTGNQSVADKLNSFASKEHVAGFADKTFYSTNAGKWIYNTGSTPQATREGGNIAGEYVTGVGVGKAIKAVSSSLSNGSSMKVMNDAPNMEIMNDSPNMKVMNDSPNMKVMNDAPNMEIMNDSPNMKVMNDKPVTNIDSSSLTRTEKINSTISKMKAEEVAYDSAVSKSGSVKQQVFDAYCKMSSN